MEVKVQKWKIRFLSLLDRAVLLVRAVHISGLDGKIYKYFFSCLPVA